ncbi:glycosyltransferase family 4 protein [Sphingobacterium rhinopitheci]|uniref:glycosyltransferase family 4 protein n=1 Tax=Sphingobacterium rhinopitheci TaxID=2781960 RepID=UPI001F52599C|nr:glycosyltransferase family 4 protein [Sphingobacterium rhinopitheci]MCI0921626.1 glycosyltransferase family 4 protein [Sphingobacterium rhinopitheci]
MRILVLHNYYQHSGGEDTVVQQEYNELSKQGHQVKIISEKNKKGLQGLLQFALYPLNIIISKRLTNEIDLFNPDIIHVHNLHYGIGPFLIRKLKKKGYPIVMTLHNFRLICPSATLFYNGSVHTESIKEDFPWTAVKNKALDHSLVKTFITAYTYWIHKKINTWQLVDRYFTFSNFSKAIFNESSLGVDPNKFTVKPNFVNSTIASTEKVFRDYYIYIGRLSEEKGIIQLLEAISKTDYRIKIFGTGPLEKQVQDYADINSNIEYLGFQNKEILQKEINSANALIVPSVCYEGMPMTIIEAFAMGTPIICSNIGILKQMVVPLYTGIQFDPYNRASIISALDTWSNMDIHTKELISKNCINEFQNKYTAKIYISLIEEVYQQLIKENEHNNYRSS